MDIGLYRRYLQEYVQEAIENSDGTNAQISSYLWSKNVAGFLVRNKTEKQRALDDARQAFDEHRHWPVQIVISHLGLDPKELGVHYGQE
jgi:hypothetical protein